MAILTDIQSILQFSILPFLCFTLRLKGKASSRVSIWSVDFIRLFKLLHKKRFTFGIGKVPLSYSLMASPWMTISVLNGVKAKWHIWPHWSHCQVIFTTLQDNAICLDDEPWACVPMVWFSISSIGNKSRVNTKGLQNRHQNEIMWQIQTELFTSIPSPIREIYSGFFSVHSHRSFWKGLSLLFCIKLAFRWLLIKW